MSPTEGSDAQPRHLHPAAVVLNVLGAVRQFLPVLILALIGGEGRVQSLLCSFGVIVPASVAVGVGRWLRFRYWTEDGELRVEEGVISKRRTFVPAEHIQAVDVTAGVLQRVFGLVKVQVKTATAGTAVELAAVSRAEAQRLREELSRVAPALAGEEAGAEETPARRYTLSRGDLLLAASTSGQLGLILSGLAYLYTRVEEYVHDRLVRWLEHAELAESVQTSDPFVVAGLVVAGLLAAWIVSIGVIVVRYGGFAVERRGEDLVVDRGLLERRTISIPRRRIQAIRVSEGLLRQPLGYGAIYVESAGHAEERGESTYLHPFLHRSRWAELLEEMAPGFSLPDDLALTHPPRRALRRFAVRPLVGTCLLAGAASLALPYGYLAFALLLPALVVAWVSYRDTGVSLGEDNAILRSRTLERVTAVVPRRRVQFAETERSLFQRRLRLGTCAVGAASGAGGRVFAVPELDEDECDRVLAWAEPRSARAPASSARPEPGAPDATPGDEDGGDRG